MTQQIGVIGLAVMGKNLAWNIESRGYSVSVFNRSSEKTDLMVEESKGKNIHPTYSLEEFVNSLEKPRKILLMVQAGKATDATIDSLLPLLDDGDILIDGGNTNYQDTIRRNKALAQSAINFIGMGVSGGEIGALTGPSLMPGGQEEAYNKVADILDAIAAKAKDGASCVTYIGPNGAGHYVKMVHNGIEYADMQLIAESYAMMKELYMSKICSYAQGFAQMRKASEDNEWNLKLGDLAMIWREGCIIRAQFLQKIKDAYDNNPGLQNLLLDPYFKNIVTEYQDALRDVVATGVQNGVPTPGFSSSINYYDSYRAADLPANLIQAQRDYFGAHTYERKDKEGVFHTQWIEE
ncbi:NADP-dependent decarboxylating phosphogluconate dehydrogenase [Staphylococcus aureus]|nr:NADP-dependent decarboxylating phosphogluconate dehydrogenase [Staphylococcus aureus]